MTNIYILYQVIFTFLMGIFLNAQVGINTSAPNAILHITDQSINLQERGMTFPNVFQFTTDPMEQNHHGLLVYYDNQGDLGKGKDGFYFYDHNNQNWQYLFKQGSEKENLFKTIVGSQGIILSATQSQNIWVDSPLVFVDTSNPSYYLRNGKLTVGKSGKYSVFYSGSAQKDDLNNSLAGVESGLFINNANSPIIFASTTLPSSDNNYRVASLNFSSIITLNQGDELSLKFRKVTNYNLPIRFNSNTHYFILTYLD
ncbi:hypothetical protein [Faecalibacter sp. LW9]|uniref:hypothetical protein n=1 Tax=Faecalibacter sp. LW9 TaxID=3103144 RepID=UPI002B00246C|nr:hypothetical protein [Faecalibacter sp. LW9]